MDTPSGAKPEGVCAHFPTKSGLTGGAKQCIVQKIKVSSCKTATNALFYNPPLHAQNTGSHHVPYRPISDKHFPPKPLSTRRQKKGTAQNTPPANDDKQPRETSLKPEPNIIAILVAAIGIIPPASSIVRKKGAGNEEMPSDKKPPSAIEPRSVNTDRFRT